MEMLKWVWRNCEQDGWYEFNLDPYADRRVSIPELDLSAERRSLITSLEAVSPNAGIPSLMRDVVDCCLEQMMSSNEGQAWRWYNLYRFGVTRD